MSKRWKKFLASLDKEDAKAAKCHKPWMTKRFKYGWIRLYRRPFALAMKDFTNDKYYPTWEEWHRKIRDIVPIQYFFRNSIPSWFHGLKSRLWYKWFDIKCFFYPRNVIRLKTIGKDGAWPDVLMTHAIFEFLDRFMLQNPDEIMDYTQTKDDKRFWIEINAAWAWWKRRKEREQGINKLHDKAAERRKNGQDASYIYKTITYEENECAKEQTDYLITIIKYRDRLWI